MDFETFQRMAHATAIYPQDRAVEYTALGLASEAGEVANKVKKLIRDGDTAEKRQALESELGDVLWYVAELATAIDADLDEVANGVLAKLRDRQVQGTLGGNGDRR